MKDDSGVSMSLIHVTTCWIELTDLRVALLCFRALSHPDAVLARKVTSPPGDA